MLCTSPCEAAGIVTTQHVKRWWVWITSRRVEHPIEDLLAELLGGSGGITRGAPLGLGGVGSWRLWLARWYCSCGCAGLGTPGFVGDLLDGVQDGEGSRVGLTGDCRHEGGVSTGIPGKINLTCLGPVPLQINMSFNRSKFAAMPCN